MRPALALPLLLLAPSLAACSVENDSANDQVSVQYNEQRIKDGAARAAHVAKEVGTGIGNVAASTGRAIRNEVGDVDVDVNVTRNRNRDSGNRVEER